MFKYSNLSVKANHRNKNCNKANHPKKRKKRLFYDENVTYARNKDYKGK